MSTIGHPLSDLVNILNPHSTASSQTALKQGIADTRFAPGAIPGLPTKQTCIEWYRAVAGWDPTDELKWGEAFGAYRGSVVFQGIAARYALRQASSAKAKDYAVKMHPWGEFAWSLVEEWKAEHEKARL